MTLTLTEFASSLLIVLLGMIALIVALRIRQSRQLGSRASSYAALPQRHSAQARSGADARHAGSRRAALADHADVRYYRAVAIAQPPLLPRSDYR